MIHETFGTTDLEMLRAMVWESGWDYVRGTIYTKEYTFRGKTETLTGTLEMRDGYYAMRAVTA